MEKKFVNFEEMVSPSFNTLTAFKNNFMHCSYTKEIYKNEEKR